MLQQVERRDKTIRHQQALNEKLTYQLATLKRHSFVSGSETLSPDQTSLLDDLVDGDIAAIEAELAEHVP